MSSIQEIISHGFEQFTQLYLSKEAYKKKPERPIVPLAEMIQKTDLLSSTITSLKPRITPASSSNTTLQRLGVLTASLQEFRKSLIKLQNEALMSFASSKGKTGLKEPVSLLQNALKAFQSKKEKQGLEYTRALLKKFPPIANKVFGNVWEFAGKPTRAKSPKIAHDNFGKVAFFNQEGRSVSLRIKADAIKSVLKILQDSPKKSCLLTTQSEPIKKSDLSNYEREHRLVTDEEHILKSLQTTYQNGMYQMKNERDSEKPFVYLDDPEDFQRIVEAYSRTKPDCLRRGSTQIGKYPVGVCHFQGSRGTMEDECLATEFTLKLKYMSQPVQLFGVFDGHGGGAASAYLAQHLSQKLSETLLSMNPEGYTLTDPDIWNALKLSFVQLNDEFETTYSRAGSTATIAMVFDGRLCVANIGDSRTILDVNGTPIQLTEDQKPDNPHYYSGILNRGGRVEDDNGTARVDGQVAVARAFGDHGLRGSLSSRPKITIFDLEKIPKGSHLLLGCDGIFDVATTRQIVKALHEHKDLAPEALAANITYSAYKAGSGDNITAMVVRF